MTLDAPETDIPEDASDAKDRAGWLSLMARIGQDQGHFRTLGARHWSYLSEDGPSLLVTFDTLEAARRRKGQMPHLADLAAMMGWSYLCLIAEGATWFRDPAVYGHFDQMIDDGVLDAYDRVTFYGAGMAGHAATAFSVACPGSVVLAIAPRASMTPSRVPFETRDRAARRLDFTSRFGFAPDMARAASRVWILRDPHHAPDAAQTALFQGRNTQILNLRHMAERIEPALAELDILSKLIVAAMKGDLSEAMLAELWRARRKFGPYLKALLNKTEAAGREGLAFAICANVARRTRAPKFRRRLEEMTEARAAKAAARV